MKFYSSVANQPKSCKKRSTILQAKFLEKNFQKLANLPQNVVLVGLTEDVNEA